MRVYDEWALLSKEPICCLGPKWGLKTESEDVESGWLGTICTTPAVPEIGDGHIIILDWVDVVEGL